MNESLRPINPTRGHATPKIGNGEDFSWGNFIAPNIVFASYSSQSKSLL
jgi:hypothetical protein